MEISPHSAFSPVTPSISAIIPCYNASATIGATLDALAHSRTPPAEIICVDDGSHDNTVEIIKQAAHSLDLPVQVVSLTKNCGSAAARNRGADRATGSMLLFIDADVISRPHALGQLWQRLESTTAAAAVALYEPSSANGGVLADFQSTLASHTFQELDPDDLPYLGTQCTLIWREAFKLSDGFSESYTDATVEDLDLGARIRSAGQTIVLAPGACIRHNRPYSLVGFTSNYLTKASGLAWLTRRSGRRAGAFGTGYASWANIASGLIIAVLLACFMVAVVVPGSRLIAIAALLLGVTALAALWRGFLRHVMAVHGSGHALVFAGIRCYVTIVGVLGASCTYLLGWRPRRHQ